MKEKERNEKGKAAGLNSIGEKNCQHFSFHFYICVGKYRSWKRKITILIRGSVCLKVSYCPFLFTTHFLENNFLSAKVVIYSVFQPPTMRAKEVIKIFVS